MIERCRWVWVALAFVAGACSKDVGSEGQGPELVPTVGGQSGQEGACIHDAFNVREFDPESSFARALGRYSTRIVWNDGRDEPQPATFEIEKLPGRPDVRGECTDTGSFDATLRKVNVHMQVPSAGVNVEFEAVAQVIGSGDEMMVSAQLDGSYESTLSTKAAGLPSDRKPTAAATKHYLDLWWYDDAVSGHLVAQRDSEFCGIARFPETYCGSLRVPFAQNKRIPGFDPERVLEMVNGLDDQLLTWEDGATTRVHFDVQSAAGSLCLGTYFPIGLAQPLRDAFEVQMPVTIHVTTDDGRVDTSVPGGLIAVISSNTGLQPVFRVESGLFGPRADVEAAGVHLFTDSAASSLGFGFHMSRETTEVHGIMNAQESDPAKPPTKLEPSWQERPGEVCSNDPVGAGASITGTFDVASQ